jgi:hypothetical protein
LAAEAFSDQLKTDFTNIAQALFAAVNGDYTLPGLGNAQIGRRSRCCAPRTLLRSANNEVTSERDSHRMHTPICAGLRQAERGGLGALTRQ